MQFKTLAFLSILPILFFVGCSSEEKKTVQESQNNQESSIQSHQNEIKLSTIDNKNITIVKENEKIIIKEYLNKTVLLNFFTTWCEPCKIEIPNLIDLQNKYSNDFVVLAILLEQGKTNEEIQSFINDFKINFPTTNSQGNFDLLNSIGSIESIPTTFIIDKESNIFQKYVGIVPIEMMEMDIKKVLKK